MTSRDRIGGAGSVLMAVAGNTPGNTPIQASLELLLVIAYLTLGPHVHRFSCSRRRPSILAPSPQPSSFTSDPRRRPRGRCPPLAPGLLHLLFFNRIPPARHSPATHDAGPTLSSLHRPAPELIAGCHGHVGAALLAERRRRPPSARPSVAVAALRASGIHAVRRWVLACLGRVVLSSRGLTAVRCFLLSPGRFLRRPSERLAAVRRFVISSWRGATVRRRRVLSPGGVVRRRPP